MPCSLLFVAVSSSSRIWLGLAHLILGLWLSFWNNEEVQEHLEFTVTGAECIVDLGCLFSSVFREAPAPTIGGSVPPILLSCVSSDYFFKNSKLKMNATLHCEQHVTRSIFAPMRGESHLVYIVSLFGTF